MTNKTVQYFIQMVPTFTFMDPATFEQFQLGADIVDSAASYPQRG